MTRRNFLPAAAASLAGAATLDAQAVARKGRLKQSATRGCFGKGRTLEEMCREGARLGLKGLDLIASADWPTLKKYGLIATMCPGGGGIARKGGSADIIKKFRENIELAAAAGMPNVIATTGNRLGMTDEEAWANCAAVLNAVKKLAEDKGVTICLELMNSKVNHPDYLADSTRWGVEVCKRVASPRVKLLYDIYHMQIMEGDVIRTIRDNIQHIGHFHTAGNPGRHEIDETQELNYRAIAGAIVATGYTAYLAHEYSPTGDWIASLDKAISICDV